MVHISTKFAGHGLSTPPQPAYPPRNLPRAEGSGREVRPNTEHFAPLFVTLGAVEAEFDTQRSDRRIWLGMAKRSIQIG